MGKKKIYKEMSFLLLARLRTLADSINRDEHFSIKKLQEFSNIFNALCTYYKNGNCKNELAEIKLHNQNVKKRFDQVHRKMSSQNLVTGI